MKKKKFKILSDKCKDCPVYKTYHFDERGIRGDDADYVLALAGNPNTGKSTIFNSLTKMHQHTGNWPGKTVTKAEGIFEYNGKKYKLVDLPGTYSLLSISRDEAVARDFILFGKPDVTIIVIDATRLERNLNLTLQIMEITDKIVIALNLVDEARRNGIYIDSKRLSDILGVPVVETVASRKKGLDKLLEVTEGVIENRIVCHPYKIEYPPSLKAAIEPLVNLLEELLPGYTNLRWIALRLLDGDQSVIEFIKQKSDGDNKDTIAALLEISEKIRWELGDYFHDELMQAIFESAKMITRECVTVDKTKKPFDLDDKIDRIVTSKIWGFPIMFLLLALVFWLTIVGANYPSGVLSKILVDEGHPFLKNLAGFLHLPWWLSGILIDGAYMATAWVVSVMLPPMAIFFPLFTFLEDAGYLPRVAFNLDGLYQKAGAHGKQALSMSMGFGCNAAGVVATRIIDSPRERLIAIITNNFSLCNGRWPTQILLATIFIGALVPARWAGLISAAAVVTVALTGIILSFTVSWLLSRTVLKGAPSAFSLELPPYRRPRLGQILYTSLIDRTLIILWRAILFAFPAGIVIWLIANIHIGNSSLANYIIDFADPYAYYFGLNGIIILAFLIGIPANEIIMPTILMLTALYLGIQNTGGNEGIFMETGNIETTAALLKAGGWTTLTAVNVMIFSLLHNPCSTTIYTIYKETGSAKWTLLATFLPVAMGLTACFLMTRIWSLF